MISITRAQVPAYLVPSDFYASLSREDSDEFDIPADNFKLTPEVENAEQLSQLLHTVRYWGVQNFTYPDSLIVYLSAVSPEEQEKVGQLLKDFEWSSELAVWFTAFHTLNQISPTEPDYEDLISSTNALVPISPFLVSKSETLRARSLAVLTVVASTCDKTANLVSWAASPHIANQGSFITDATSVAFVRDLAKLLSHVCKYFEARNARLVMPLLTRLLSWPDDETVSGACHAIGRLAEVGGDYFAIVFKARLAPRLVELVKSDAPALQPAALRACKYLFLPHNSN